MKPTVAMCAVALVLVLTTAASAAPQSASSSSGTGLVFVTNPVQSLGDESLTDQKDADAAVPQAAYHQVALTNLDATGYLRGDYVDVVTETGKAAFSATNTFRYTRHEDEFEQVMAYFWVTEAQTYIRSLGFGTTQRAIGIGPLRVRINQWVRTTRSRPTIRGTSSASGKAASTTPRTPR